MIINLISPEEIEVTVFNRKDLLDMLNVHGVKNDSDEFFEAVAEMTQVGQFTQQRKAGRSSLDGGGGFTRVELVYDYDQSPLKPYWELMKHALGVTPFSINLIPGLRSPRVCHTHYLETLRYDAETAKLTVVTTFELYNFLGKVFIDATARRCKAERDAQDKIWDRLRGKQSVPEYIELPGGLFKKNPAWGSYSRPKFTNSIEDDKLLLYMANEWARQFATPGQQAVIERIHRSDRAQVEWFHDRNHNNQFLLDNCHGQISFEDFKKLT